MKTCGVSPLFVLCLLVSSSVLVAADHTLNGDSKLLSSSSSTAALTKKIADDNVIRSVVKGLVDFASNGFKVGLEASVRSLFNKPVTTAVYALSMLVGVVAMLAFYESPISPLPVPALPDPPVGRFPPEHPVWPPNQAGQAKSGAAYANHQRVGPMTAQASQLVPQMMVPAGMAPAHMHNQHNHGLQIPQANYQSVYRGYGGSDNHRSDKQPHSNVSPLGPVLAMRHRKPTPLANNHLNETFYNNYISKLTTTLDLNNNYNNSNTQGIEQLKHIFSPASELSNKVIDYNNKRMAVESLKYNNLNSNQTVS